MFEGRVFRAEVVSASPLRVEIPKSFPGQQIPAEDYSGLAQVTTSAASAGTVHTHTVTQMPLAIGDKVLVCFDESGACCIIGRKVTS